MPDPNDPKLVSLVIVAFVYTVFNVQLTALRMQTEFRDLVLGVLPDKILKDKHRIMYFENDWKKLWTLTLVSDFAFGVVCLAILVFYRSAPEVVIAAACAGTLMFTAFGGMLFSGVRDYRMMKQEVDTMRSRLDEAD